MPRPGCAPPACLHRRGLAALPAHLRRRGQVAPAHPRLRRHGLAAPPARLRRLAGAGWGPPRREVPLLKRERGENGFGEKTEKKREETRLKRRRERGRDKAAPAARQKIFFRIIVLVLDGGSVRY